MSNDDNKPEDGRCIACGHDCYDASDDGVTPWYSHDGASVLHDHVCLCSGYDRIVIGKLRAENERRCSDNSKLHSENNRLRAGIKAMCALNLLSEWAEKELRALLQTTEAANTQSTSVKKAELDSKP